MAGARQQRRRGAWCTSISDTDLDTPESTRDGALDWMGVAHLLGIEGTPAGSRGRRRPQADAGGPEQVLYSPTSGRSTELERREIAERAISGIPEARVVADPPAPRKAVARRLGAVRFLLHLDVDVLDSARMPLAETPAATWGSASIS